MRRTLLIGVGTAGSAVIQHARRRRQASVRSLERQLHGATPEDRPVLEQAIAALQSSIRILSIDLDGTDAYRLPAPLESEDSGWGVGESLKISLHPREVV